MYEFGCNRVIDNWGCKHMNEMRGELRLTNPSNDDNIKLSRLHEFPIFLLDQPGIS